jgi:hypothetical protein
LKTLPLVVKAVHDRLADLIITKYSANQRRDRLGRFSATGGGGSSTMDAKRGGTASMTIRLKPASRSAGARDPRPGTKGYCRLPEKIRNGRPDWLRPGMRWADPNDPKDWNGCPPKYEWKQVPSDKKTAGYNWIGYSKDKNTTQTQRGAAKAGKADREKWANERKLAKKLPAIEKKLADGIKKGDQRAIAMHLVAKTGFRIGSPTDTNSSKGEAFGALTLKMRHVKVGTGNNVTFAFTGKHGVAQKHTIKDPAIAQWARHRAKQKKATLFDVSYSRTKDYWDEMSGGANPKDLRTAKGTAVALKAIKGYPKPANDAEEKRYRREIAEQTAAVLGNEWKTAHDSYINPIVWDQWGGTKKRR